MATTIKPRHKVMVDMDLELFNYIRSLSNYDTARLGKYRSINLICNDLILAGILAETGGLAPSEAAKKLARDLSILLNMDDLDRLGESKL